MTFRLSIVRQCFNQIEKSAFAIDVTLGHTAATTCARRGLYLRRERCLSEMSVYLRNTISLSWLASVLVASSARANALNGAVQYVPRVRVRSNTVIDSRSQRKHAARR